MLKNSLANQEKCVIIKDLANQQYKKALTAIHARLLKWAGLTSKSSRMDDDYREEFPEWLEETAELFDILKNFRRVMGLKKQAEGVNATLSRENSDGTRESIEIHNPGIRNWQCGMCQMIDTRNDAICEVLPVLLTAYVYNFPDNTLVHQFLDRNPLGRGLKEKRDRYIYGAEKYPISDTDKIDEATGFERLMFETVIDCPEDRNMIKDISELFRFKNFSPYNVKSRYDNPENKNIYFLPKRFRTDFIKNCTLQKTKLYPPSGKPFWHRVIFAPNGFDFYYYKTMLEIMGYFYTTISKRAKQKESHFVKTPNPIFCWILILQALRCTVDLKYIQKAYNSNKFSEQEIYEDCDNLIRKKYTRRPIPTKADRDSWCDEWDE